MARQKNLVKTKPITVAISARVYETLVSFTTTQYAGKNPAATAEQMILVGIDAITRGDGLVATALKQGSPRKKQR